MERRNFLRFGGFAAVSVATLSGCGGGSSSPAPATASPAAGGGGWKFPQSVASGDPRPDSVVLWTRCVPTSADDVLTSTTPAFGIRLVVSSGDHAAKLGTNQALASELVLDVLQDVKPEFDHTVRHKVTGLKPASVYYYQFAAGDVRSNVGRFKTAPAQDADVAQLRELSLMTAKPFIYVFNVDEEGLTDQGLQERMRALVDQGLSGREIADAIGRSQATVRYWLGKYGLKTTRPVRPHRPARTVYEDRVCSRHGLGSHALGGVGGPRCVRCRSEAVSQWRRRAKATLLAEAGGACVACGYDRCAAALHFHHRDPATKEFAIGGRGLAHSIDRLRREAAKCDLLCSNCHAEVEAGLRALA